jgi:hypothetical protein
MRQLIKKFLCVLFLASGLQVSWGFALEGPLANGGDAWQLPTIGYGYLYIANTGTPGGPVFLGDIAGPKNIGEEYRRNVPTLYYAYNANYLGFFGSNGMAAADSAFAIMNNLTNVDAYSPSLSEFPLQAMQLNNEASALYLTDVKSVTLHLLVEQMGLSQPERFTWTLHDRFLPSGGKCPINELYLLVQRNFDFVSSPLNQLQYSAYVNDVLYTYSIEEECTGPNPLAVTIPFSVDPLAEQYTAVAANNFDNFGGLQIGNYYTGLTRDDVAGLRYLLTTNNINTETAGAGSAQVVTNSGQNVVVTTQPISLLVAQSLTNDPATLQQLYPGLIVSSTITNFPFFSATNIIAYYTNQPGPSVTNYGSLILWTNYDLNLFSWQATTDAPPVLQALYPTLLILSSTTIGYTTVTNPVVVTYLTNRIGAPQGSPPKMVTLTNGYTFDYIQQYGYVFGNIKTNTYSTKSTVTIQTIMVTNLIGAPAGSLKTNITTATKVLTNNVSGDFFIVPTNWCGYSIFATQSVQKVPSYTNILTAISVTNSFGSSQFSQNTIYYFTNRVYAVAPGVCEPALVFATNVTIGIATNYQQTFANVVTNTYFTNSYATMITTNIGACSNGVAGTLCTNITTTTTTVTNSPSGDFFIVPADWCGYVIVSTQQTNTVFSTNTVTTPVPPGVTDIGQQYSVTTISAYTNHVFLITPLICTTTTDNLTSLRQGIGRVKFVKANFDSLISQFFQPITNYYSMTVVTNSQLTVQYFQRVATAPDILFTATDQGGANTFNGTVFRNINFDQGNVLPGLAGPGVINSQAIFNFNKIGAAFQQFGFPDTNSFIFPSEVNQLTQTNSVSWASFDGSTNEPVVYPNGTSIDNLGNMILVQVSPPPPILPTGTNGVAYPAITFTATGGSFSPSFTWTVPTGLPSGLALSPAGILSGTPTQSGVFDIILQLTDSLSRSVQWNYSITIQ